MTATVLNCYNTVQTNVLNTVLNIFSSLPPPSRLLFFDIFSNRSYYSTPPGLENLQYIGTTVYHVPKCMSCHKVIAPFNETYLDAVRWLIYLTNRFQPVHQQEELVGAMLLRSSRTKRSSCILYQGLDSMLRFLVTLAFHRQISTPLESV